MKNLKFIVASAILVCCAAVHGEALYWMVDTTNPGWNGYTGNDVAFATLNAIPSSSVTPGAAATPGSGTTIDVLEVVGGTTAAPTLGDLGDYGSSGYSFFVELFNASGESVYTQHAVSYTDLVTSGYVSTGGVDVPSFSGTVGFNGASVPEPTSGVLMLIGASLLALRRRKLA